MWGESLSVSSIMEAEIEEWNGWCAWWIHSLMEAFIEACKSVWSKSKTRRSFRFCRSLWLVSTASLFASSMLSEISNLPWATLMLSCSRSGSYLVQVNSKQIQERLLFYSETSSPQWTQRPCRITWWGQPLLFISEACLAFPFCLAIWKQSCLLLEG